MSIAPDELGDPAVSKPNKAALAATGVAALGIVFGDIGTSPLYTLKTAFDYLHGDATPDRIIGILSLVFWTLFLITTVKYVIVAMTIDNDGEGGILALMSLLGIKEHKRPLIVMAGLLGAALIYGDGAITPAISVLSALEGFDIAAPGLKHYVVPTAVAILLALFAVQPLGTSRIGAAFGPIMLLWFVVIGALGLWGIAQEPSVLVALNPYYGVKLLATNGFSGFLVLGGIFLCVTGAEALLDLLLQRPRELAQLRLQAIADSGKAIALDHHEGQHRLAPPSLRRELDTVVEVEVVDTFFRRNLHLIAFDVVFVTVQDGPDFLFAHRPAAGVNAISKHGRHRFPVFADEERRDPALDRGNAPGGFAVARRDSIPDAPDVFPALPSHSVEESELQVVGFVAIPTVRDVHHVPRFKPFVFVHERSERELILPPGHDVPGQGFVGGTAFRFKCQGMASLVRGQRECERNAILRIAVDAVGPDFCHQIGNRIGPRQAGVTRALVPHHHRKKYTYAAVMEVGDHLLHAGNASRHAADQVVLIPVVDSHIGVGRPN